MNVIGNQMQRLLIDEAGQDVIEYALLAGLVALAAFAAMHNFGRKLSSGYTRIGKQL